MKPIRYDPRYEKGSMLTTTAIIALWVAVSVPDHHSNDTAAYASSFNAGHAMATAKKLMDEPALVYIEPNQPKQS